MGVSVIRSIIEMQKSAVNLRSERKQIAVVPTMGYLHSGHASLIALARNHADVVITTIFVNPTQFGPTEDFERYPRDFDRDRELALSAGTDIIFHPDVTTMYPAHSQTTVLVEGISKGLEGASRPDHFRGVATIVAKLFNLTKPHVAVFGQKDAQQVEVIRRMAIDLNFDVQIVVGPTIREGDGLAMSSRNSYLAPKERQEAVALFQSLQLAENMIREGERDCAILITKMKQLIESHTSGIPDYISVSSKLTLEEMSTLQRGDEILISLAVRFGKTRLIDNSVLSV